MQPAILTFTGTPNSAKKGRSDLGAGLISLKPTLFASLFERVGLFLYVLTVMIFSYFWGQVLILGVFNALTVLTAHTGVCLWVFFLILTAFKVLVVGVCLGYMQTQAFLTVLRVMGLFQGVIYSFEQYGSNFW